MTLSGGRFFEVETTFLVSREGVATVSVDPILERTMGVPLHRPGFSGRTQQALHSVDKGTGPVEITFDRGEWVIGAIRDAIDEREAESMAGDVAHLCDVVRRLAADAFMRRMRGHSGRGHRQNGHDGLIAHGAQVEEIPGDLAAGEGFARVARSCLTQMSTNAQLLRSGSNREALHQLRVGVRRLRAAFATFKPILPCDALDRWKTETKWFASELETARDLDVFIEYVSGSTNADTRSDPMLAAFGERLILAQAMAYDLALAAVNSKRFAGLLLDFTEWVEVAPWSSDDDVVMAILGDDDSSVLAAQALKRLHRQLSKTGKHLAALDPAGRHAVRIKAKKLRYAAEFFSHTFGSNARKRHSKFISSLTRLQNALGELNDMATARQYALALAGRNAELAFRAGQVVDKRCRNEPRLLARAVRAYEQWSDAKRFWA